MTDGAKYETTTAAMDPFTWRSEFTIYNITNSDYGDYECLARNSEGSSKHRILLDVKSRPDAPQQLQVLINVLIKNTTILGREKMYK